MQRNELLIEADELAGMIDDPNLRLFDATVLMQSDDGKTARDRYLAGHLPGAVFLDHAALSDANSELMYMIPNESVLAQAIGDLGIGNDNPVVVYSTDFIAWATRIWWVLYYAGHRNVRVLNGGIETWAGELETGESTYPNSRFSSNLSPGMMASKEEVLKLIGDGTTCIVNTLPEAMYKGESEVFYSGHITGSVNHPFSDFMDGNYLLPDDDLKQKFAEKMTGERLITYCGGGIAATLNACAARLAGLEDVAVYDGSMSEWLAEELPITQGSEPGSLE